MAKKCLVVAVVDEPGDVAELAFPLLQGLFVTAVLAGPITKRGSAIGAAAVIADITLVKREFAQRRVGALAHADDAESRESPALRAPSHSV